MLPLCFAHALRHMPHRASHLPWQVEKSWRCNGRTRCAYCFGRNFLRPSPAGLGPTASVSAHRSQNELHRDITHASHRPAFLCSFSPAYSFCSNAFQIICILPESQPFSFPIACAYYIPGNARLQTYNAHDIIRKTYVNGGASHEPEPAALFCLRRGARQLH